MLHALQEAAAAKYSPVVKELVRRGVSITTVLDLYESLGTWSSQLGKVTGTAGDHETSVLTGRASDTITSNMILLQRVYRSEVGPSKKYI